MFNIDINKKLIFKYLHTRFTLYTIYYKLFAEIHAVNKCAMY